MKLAARSGHFSLQARRGKLFVNIRVHSGPSFLKFYSEKKQRVEVSSICGRLRRKPLPLETGQGGYRVSQDSWKAETQSALAVDPVAAYKKDAVPVTRGRRVFATSWQRTTRRIDKPVTAIAHTRRLRNRLG